MLYLIGEFGSEYYHLLAKDPKFDSEWSSERLEKLLTEKLQAEHVV